MHGDQAHLIERVDERALVQQLLRAAGSRDAARVLDCYAPDAVAISPVFGEVRGREAVAATWTTLFNTFSDLTIQNVDFRTSGHAG